MRDFYCCDGVTSVTWPSDRPKVFFEISWGQVTPVTKSLRSSHESHAVTKSRRQRPEQLARVGWVLAWVNGALGERAHRGTVPIGARAIGSRAFVQGTDLCALSALCVRKMSHAESAEIAEACGLGGVPIEGR